MISFYLRFLVFLATVALAIWWFSRSNPKAWPDAKNEAVRAWVDDFLVKQQQK